MVRFLISILLLSSVATPYELYRPYSWQLQSDERRRAEWDYIESCKPPESEFLKTMLKPPTNLAAGDAGTTVESKLVNNETNIVADQLKQGATKAIIESNPGLQRTMDKAQSMTPKMQTTTFNIKHDLKYDLSSNTAIYTAEADSLTLSLRHQTYNDHDNASIAYKLDPVTSCGVKMETPFNTGILFLESKW